ncbi:MAG TPA: GNAT family N-acetyltransferase [Allosphingosinicella sp.]|nr:GNAT family N-acetyltransferase [Allosphingosinicella sp.]
MALVPELKTPRLRLRALAEEDLQAWSQVTSDPEVTRHLGGATLSREETWRRLLATAGSWPILGYGYWTVESKDDGRMIGHVGFADFKRDLTPSLEGLPEMGWVFARDVHGQGYASEAVKAGLQWAERELAGQTLTAIIHPENAASIRVAEKAGFGQPVETRYRGEPILIFYRQPAS